MWCPRTKARTVSSLVNTESQDPIVCLRYTDVFCELMIRFGVDRGDSTTIIVLLSIYRELNDCYSALLQASHINDECGSRYTQIDSIYCIWQLFLRAKWRQSTYLRTRLWKVVFLLNDMILFVDWRCRCGECGNWDQIAVFLDHHEVKDLQSNDSRTIISPQERQDI
jgi:hypothetical protein